MEPRTRQPAPLPSAKEPSHRPAPCPRPEGHVLSQPSLCLGAMSLAGAQGSLWSVEGGNKLVCSGLLKLTKANVIHATVTSVTLQQTGESTGRGRGHAVPGRRTRPHSLCPNPGLRPPGVAP